MIFYSDDEQDIFIGVHSIDIPENKIIKKVSRITGIDFNKTDTIPDDMETHSVLDFEMDTIIVNAKDFNEDFEELSSGGIAIYIIP